MLPPNYRPLFDSLYTKTMRGEVNWKPTAKEDNFAVYFKGLTLTMSTGRRMFRDEIELYIDFTLRNPEGMKIDSFQVGDESDPDEVWKQATDLHDAARRKALNIDEAIDDIVSELQSGGPVGEDIEPEDDDLPF